MIEVLHDAMITTNPPTTYVFHQDEPTGKPIPRRVDGNMAKRKLPAAPAATGTAASSCLVAADSTG